MGQSDSKNRIFTIPNLLSLLRLVMIPFILYFYLAKGNTVAAFILVLLSGVTDLMDGYIARHFNQISELGKILDPIADKLTELAFFICLLTRWPLVWLLLAVSILRELIVPATGMAVIRYCGVVTGSRWYGKVSTFVLYIVVLLLFLFPGMPAPLANGMILVCVALSLLATILYARMYIGMLVAEKKRRKAEAEAAEAKIE